MSALVRVGATYESIASPPEASANRHDSGALDEFCMMVCIGCCNTGAGDEPPGCADLTMPRRAARGQSTPSAPGGHQHSQPTATWEMVLQGGRPPILGTSVRSSPLQYIGGNAPHDGRTRTRRPAR